MSYTYYGIYLLYPRLYLLYPRLSSMTLLTG